MGCDVTHPEAWPRGLLRCVRPAAQQPYLPDSLHWCAMHHNLIPNHSNNVWKRQLTLPDSQSSTSKPNHTEAHEPQSCFRQEVAAAPLTLAARITPTGLCAASLPTHPHNTHMLHSSSRRAVAATHAPLAPEGEQARKLWRKGGECYSSSFVCFESSRHGH